MTGCRVYPDVVRHRIKVTLYRDTSARCARRRG